MAKFVLAQVSTGYKFNLVAGNGEVIASSQVYKTASSAKKGNTIIMAPTVEAKNEDGSTILNCADKSAEDKLFNQLTGAI